MATLSTGTESGLPIAGSARPLYRRIQDWVRARIGSGEWPVHHKIPSEHQLVEQLGVSRMTVHRALKELTVERTLVRVAGVGTFVAPGKGHQAFLQIESIRDEVVSRGNRHSCMMLLLRREVATADLAVLFGVDAQSDLFHSQIVHYENELPIMVEDKYVHPVLVPEYLEQDFTKSSTSHYLRASILATEAEQCVEAIDPSRRMRRLLGYKKGPCLLLSRRVWVQDTVAVHSQRFYRGTPYRLGSRFKKSARDFNEVR